MLSRRTDLLTTDGEKNNRNRHIEFIEPNLNSAQLLTLWDYGWNCYMSTLDAPTSDDLLKTIYIQKKPLLVVDAINRQLAYYPYHAGQIIYLAKIIKNIDWYYLSISKGYSQQFNEQQ